MTDKVQQLKQGSNMTDEEAAAALATPPYVNVLADVAESAGISNEVLREELLELGEKVLRQYETLQRSVSKVGADVSDIKADITDIKRAMSDGTISNGYGIRVEVRLDPFSARAQTTFATYSSACHRSSRRL